MGNGTEIDNGFENGGTAASERKDPGLMKEEIGEIIRCKKILQKIGHGSDLNIKGICEDIGISRKTAYSYDAGCEQGKQDSPGLGLEELKRENELLKSRLKRVELENKGLRLTKMLVEDLKKKGF